MKNTFLGLVLIAATGVTGAANACQPEDINGIWKLYGFDYLGPYRTTVIVKNGEVVRYRPVVDGFGDDVDWIVGGKARVNRHCKVTFKLELESGAEVRTTHAFIDEGKTVISGITEGSSFTAVKRKSLKRSLKTE